MANSDLPKRTQFFEKSMLKKSMPDSICRIGVRQPRHFRYHLLFGNEINRKRWVDQEVNLPEERRPRRSMVTRVFRYHMHIGKEINRKRWVDQEVNLPTLSTFFYSATNTTLFLKMVAVEYVLKKLDGIFYI